MLIEYLNLRHKIKAAQEEVEKLNKILCGYKDELEDTKNKISDAKAILKKTERINRGYIEAEDIAFNNLYYGLDNLSEIEKSISDIEEFMLSKLGADEIINITRKYTIDGSVNKGERFQRNYCKNLLIALNNYIDKKEKTISIENINHSIDLIYKQFKKLNKQAKDVGFSVNQDYVDLRIEKIKYILMLKRAKEEEKEKIRKEKQRLKEQEKLLEEAEKAKKKLVEERKQYELALAKSINEQEQAEIRAKLADIDSREADIDYRITQQKAGWLYVIESKSLPNMVKIGCTRRLNPFARIKELSSASLPFPFVCRGLVFSEDVFGLETKVHEYYSKQRTNAENGHKEFFNITPAQAIWALKNKFGCDIQFVKTEDEFNE